jgi:PAS domain S-box-containing protein
MRRLPLIYFNVPALRPGTRGGYALAVMSVGAGTVLRLAVDPYVTGVPFITFWPAVIVTALISGLGAGLFCVVLSTAAADFFELSPRLSLYVENPADVLDLLLYAVLASFCVVIVSQTRDAIEREQAERALRKSKERLQLALDAARLGWWQYDPVRRAVSGDQRFTQIFDVAAGMTPIEEIMTRVHQDYREMGWAALEAALDPVDPKRSATEFPLRRRDGEFRWVEVCGLAYFEGRRGERRAVSMVGTAQDITERRSGEERERLLMREINHRAKNMLSVVDAIARQTATRDNTAHFVDRFSERIQALSANQDLLIQNAWHGVEIEDLVRAQLAPFADLLGSRIALSGPKLRLNAAAAQAIGLALHELSTNAGKYGALSTDTGRVDIGWGAEGDTFTMSLTEREGPPVTPPRRRGFGTVVMKEMAERSVNGTVGLEYAPSGVRWRLTCPALNALEPAA